MKMFCTLVGIALIVIAGIYFVTPADTLPGFFPGRHMGGFRDGGGGGFRGGPLP